MRTQVVAFRDVLNGYFRQFQIEIGHIDEYLEHFRNDDEIETQIGLGQKEAYIRMSECIIDILNSTQEGQH